MRSGENATNTSRPGRSPRSASGSHSSSRVRADVGGARQDDHLAATRVRDHRRAGRRAGSAGRARGRSSTGVGTQIRTASAAASAPGVGRERELVELERPAAGAPCRAAAGPRCPRGCPAAAARSRRPRSPEAVRRQGDPGRQPDVAEPEHRHRASPDRRPAAPESGRNCGARGVVEQRCGGLRLQSRWKASLPFPVCGREAAKSRNTRLDAVMLAPPPSGPAPLHASTAGRPEAHAGPVQVRRTFGQRERQALGSATARERRAPASGLSQMRWSSRPSRQKPSPSPRSASELDAGGHRGRRVAEPDFVRHAGVDVVEVPRVCGRVEPRRRADSARSAPPASPYSSGVDGLEDPPPSGQSMPYSGVPSTNLLLVRHRRRCSWRPRGTAMSSGAPGADVVQCQPQSITNT